MDVLTKLSDTRWQYKLGKRVYYVRLVKAPDEGVLDSGIYWVDGGDNHSGTLTADSIEDALEELREGTLLIQLATPLS